MPWTARSVTPTRSATSEMRTSGFSEMHRSTSRWFVTKVQPASLRSDREGTCCTVGHDGAQPQTAREPGDGPIGCDETVSDATDALQVVRISRMAEETGTKLRLTVA